MNVIFVYDPNDSRLARVLMFVTLILTLMFGSAVLNAQVSQTPPLNHELTQGVLLTH